MSSYLSGLLTTTTSRYNSFRSAISTSETDGDTPDDTHLCRVLRSYYIEKGRPFPAWLPPDPKAPQPVQAQYPPQNNVGAGYGGPALIRGESKLGSLWGDNNAAGAQQPQSLRQGVPARGASTQNIRANQPAASARNPYDRSQTQQLAPEVQARPLPSQRAGSYQAGAAPPGSATATAGSTAQDRLKARLWGAARAASPGLNGPAGGGTGQLGSHPPAVIQAVNAFSRTNSHGTQGSASSNYDDGYSSGGRSAEKPYVAAGTPWDDGGYGAGAGRQGLPSGPAAGRRTGLPGGPRPQR